MDTPEHMTRQDAGRIGGKETAKRHGPDFFKKIGQMGGKARKKLTPPDDERLPS